MCRPYSRLERRFVIGQWDRTAQAAVSAGMGWLLR